MAIYAFNALYNDPSNHTLFSKAGRRKLYQRVGEKRNKNGFFAEISHLHQSGCTAYNQTFIPSEENKQGWFFFPQLSNFHGEPTQQRQKLKSYALVTKEQSHRQLNATEALIPTQSTLSPNMIGHPWSSSNTTIYMTLGPQSERISMRQSPRIVSSNLSKSTKPFFTYLIQP